MSRKGRRAADSVSENLSDTDQLAQNITPSEADSVLFLTRHRFVELEVDFEIIKKPYPEDAFIIDHPIRGDLDNTDFIFNLDYEDDEVIV